MSGSYKQLKMNNTGISFIVWDTGWACSDDAIFDVEQDPVKGTTGKINLIETKTIKLNHIFEGAGKIVKGEKVFCLFKSEGKKSAFVGEIRGKSGNLTVVDLHGKSEYLNEIISKIKGGK